MPDLGEQRRVLFEGSVGRNDERVEGLVVAEDAQVGLVEDWNVEARLVISMD